MEEKAKDLEEAVEDWKSGIDKSNIGSLELEKDLIFNGRTQRGYEVEYDAGMQWGCSPTETLIMSLAGCLGIDVVFFLRKMRAEIKTFRVDYEGERNLTPPQYYKKIDMMINISGSGITPKKIERAISLSQEKYCSVQHTLRSDLEVNVNYKIEEDIAELSGA
ncbi:MAG: OsmC family protein [Nitrospira sp.]|nr:OsmC family protein [Nitrospira sp.]